MKLFATNALASTQLLIAASATAATIVVVVVAETRARLDDVELELAGDAHRPNGAVLAHIAAVRIAAPVEAVRPDLARSSIKDIGQ